MTIDHVRHLLAYNEWANGRFIEAIDTLTDEQYTRRIESSFPTIGDTLAHIVSAEWIWLQRFRGTSPPAPPAWQHGSSLADLRREFAAVEAERQSFVRDLDDRRLGASLSYRNLAGQPFDRRLADLITHLVNHSTYHRGQLTTMLRQVGAKAPATDFTLFVPEPC